MADARDAETVRLELYRLSDALPCLLFEDDHLLVVNKPPGWNTHSPSPYAGEGIYDWLRHREARWADLAIMHRLDKETSGVLAFAKTPTANRSLTEQFSQRTVRKRYLLIADRPVPDRLRVVRSRLARVGDRYASRPDAAMSPLAETRFRPLERIGLGTLVEAIPTTGRTHQIRVHAAQSGFPILGDALYGGSPALRLHLHANELGLRHPATGEPVTFRAPPDWQTAPSLALREAVILTAETDAYRLVHGAADGWPGWYVDRFGAQLLAQVEAETTSGQRAELAGLLRRTGAQGAYVKQRDRCVRSAAPIEAAPQLALGQAAPAEVVVRENGLRFRVSFTEGYSVGLFLDQRDNRRRLLAGNIAAGFPVWENAAKPPEVLNLFAYTCGFSVCAAVAGARTTNIDLSRKYLAWGRANFALNGLDPAGHEFLYGDVFDWLRRLAKRGRAFDAVLVDPPTFSTSKAGGRFQAEKDWPRLLAAVLPLVRHGGLLFASTNAARLPPERFIDQVAAAARHARRGIARQHYVPQPPDCPVTRAEPAYLKTLWLRLG